jgi:hypothetical protein
VGRSASPAAAICSSEGWGIGTERDSAEHDTPLVVGLGVAACTDVHDAHAIATIAAVPAERVCRILALLIGTSSPRDREHDDPRQMKER